MTTLIIPDIHQDTYTVDAIIAKTKHDRVVFLGDYFDNFNEGPHQSYQTAEWLQKRMAEHPEDAFLIGNHDVWYLWGVGACSGNTKDKKIAIWSALKSVQHTRARLGLVYIVDGWLLSHAGLSNGLHITDHDNLCKELDKCRDLLESGGSHYLLEAGKDRGGWRPRGGITWCDYRNFEPHPAFPKQIFGHTRSGHVRNKGDNWCIDTGINNFAIIEDGALSVLSV